MEIYGNVSSIRVHFSASYFSLLECIGVITPFTHLSSVIDRGPIIQFITIGSHENGHEFCLLIFGTIRL